MTESSEGSKAAPGSTAGDSAPTQAIPRIPRPEATGPAAKKTSASKPAPKPISAETDKGRPRQAPPAPPAPPVASSAPAAAKGAAGATSAPAAPPETKRGADPVGGPVGRPLTAADYARTTKGSPASTSVIPAVKDKPKNGSPAATLTPSPTTGTGRRASLRLTHVEPWSVTRLAFAISVAMMIVAVVAVIIFWVVLDVVGVWNQINDSFTTVLSDDTSSFNVKDYFGFGRVVGLTLVLSAVNVVIMTVLATIGAHLYNLAAQLMGGVELTFAEEK